MTIDIGHKPKGVAIAYLDGVYPNYLVVYNETFTSYPVKGMILYNTTGSRGVGNLGSNVSLYGAWGITLSLTDTGFTFIDDYAPGGERYYIATY